MKILTAEQIREADTYTINHEPIASIDLMERAAYKCVDWICENVGVISPGAHHLSECCFDVLVGLGNNAGDGLAIARILADRGAKVSVTISSPGKEGSADFEINLSRLKKSSVEIKEYDSTLKRIELFEGSTIIDCLFGIGLNRQAKGDFLDLIFQMNSAENRVIAIDLPSGMIADGVSEIDTQGIVAADFTLSFQSPKIAFFLSDYAFYLGKLVLLDIGLHKDHLNSVGAKYHLVTKEVAARFRKHRGPFDHKGTFGHALIFAGSQGMRGAGVMAAKGALRVGAGLVTLHTDKMGVKIIHNQISEALVSIDTGKEAFITNLPNLSGYNALAVGPGIGVRRETASFLKLLIQESSKPIVLDADAINILSQNPTWLAFLPKRSILTPHPGEFARLVGRRLSHYDNIQKQIELSQRFGIYILLKGGRSSLSLPDGQILINDSGNPGMATAGMGDVLTGIIVGLLASGYSAMEAATLGMFIHGYAADLALENESYESLIATDLLTYLGRAFKSLEDEI